MYVEAKTFDLHLTLLKNNFDIVSLKEVNSLRKEKSKYRNRMSCVITFDDGWLDFFTTASPILLRHGVPATVFLPTDFIGSEKWFWTDRLTFLFSGKDKESSLMGKTEGIRNPVARQVVSLKGNSIQKLDKAIRLLKAYRLENIEEIITELSTAWGSDPNPPGRAFMSWEEVTEVAQSGLIEFGSHTASHPILTTLNNNEIQEELKRSRYQLLEHKVVDPKFIPFCYPNGDFDARIKSMVEDAGFSAAVTTQSGWNNPDEEIYALRRIGLHQDVSSNDALFGCRIAGLM
jgi:peptidoglycan/xylan/chitin deacetylase (PgdA/CDA1 family)